MKTKYLSLSRFLGLGVAYIFCSCISNTSGRDNEGQVYEEAEKDLKVIAYYTGTPASIDDETVRQLDQIIYSFLHLNSNVLDVSDSRDSISIAYLASLKQVNPQLKVLISLGGWGGCETCSDVFSEEKGRQEFSRSVKDILADYEADGIDLDWEYPAVEGYPGHAFKPEDRENFTALVEELRSTLGEDYVISFAAGGFRKFMEESVEWKKVMPLLDHVNLMSYDLVNGGSTATGHHTALYNTNDQLLSADESVRYLDSLGIPKEKIVIGAAFYARVWEEVNPDRNGLYQPGKFREAVLYRDLDSFAASHPGFITYWDSTAQARYSYNPEKKMFATYDDSLSIAMKTRYALKEGLGGIMFWQLSGDTPEEGLVDVIDRVIKESPVQ